MTRRIRRPVYGVDNGEERSIRFKHSGLLRQHAESRVEKCLNERTVDHEVKGLLAVLLTRCPALGYLCEVGDGLLGNAVEKRLDL